VIGRTVREVLMPILRDLSTSLMELHEQAAIGRPNSSASRRAQKILTGTCLTF